MLDVRRSPELQAALLGMRQAQREVKNNINREARKRIKPLWTGALDQQASTRGERAALVKGGRVTVTDQGVRMLAATSNRKLKGGLIPSQNWHGFEFGMTPQRRTYEVRSPLGNSYQVTKMMGRQFRRRYPKGRVGYSAAGAVGIKLVGIWVRTIVDGFSIFAEIKAGR